MLIADGLFGGIARSPCALPHEREELMKEYVWIVYEDDPYDDYMLAVCKTEELANEWIKRHCEDFDRRESDFCVFPHEVYTEL